MTTAEAEALLDQDLSEHIAESETVQAEPYPPLLRQLDRIAEAEGTSRGEIIQRALWAYVNERGTAK
jgi:predicted transcriptional regulator